MQAAQCPGSISSREGTPSAHAGMTYGQRVRNAARGRIGWTRRIARQEDAPAPVHWIEARRCREQRPCVGMARPLDNRCRRPLFHDPAKESTTTLSQRLRTTGRSWLMNSSARPKSRAQVGKHRQDLRLDRDVQRRDGLVRDDEIGPRSERSGDANALPLAAAELVRIAIGMLRLQSDLREQVLNALATLPGRHQAVDREAVRDLRADLPARIEARIGVLEDDLHAPPEPAQRRRVRLDEIDAVEDDVAGTGRDEAEQQTADRALARPTLAHEADSLVLADRQVDICDSLHGATAPERRLLYSAV